MGIKGERVLLVDDDRDIRNMLKLILEFHGQTVVTANSGEDACKLFKEQCFDCVIMDVKMPGMDGVEAMKVMKEIRKGTPVILMTAYANDPKIEEARESGVHQILFKPFTGREFIKLLYCKSESNL